MDVSGYSEIPFREHGRDRDGVDCYGLLVLIFKEQLGIELQDDVAGYKGTGRVHAAEIAAVIEGGMSCWLEVDEADAIPGDVVLLRIWNHPMHVGFIFESGRMIHAFEGAGVCVGRLGDGEWKGRKLGFYRHEKMWRRQDQRANFETAWEVMRNR